MVAGHATATVNGTVIADTTEWEVVDGNVYFPAASLKKDFFTTTEHHTTCPWKGQASYYTIEAGGSKLENAAWFYPSTKSEAKNIEGYVAFYKNKVDVVAK